MPHYKGEWVMQIYECQYPFITYLMQVILKIDGGRALRQTDKMLRKSYPVTRVSGIFLSVHAYLYTYMLLALTN